MSALPRCWGSGLSHTATGSLCRALTLLGYQRVVPHAHAGGERP